MTMRPGCPREGRHRLVGLSKRRAERSRSPPPLREGADGEEPWRGGLLQLFTPVYESITSWNSIADRANQKDVKWVGADGNPNYPGPNLPLTGYLGPKAAAKLFADRRPACLAVRGDPTGRRPAQGFPAQPEAPAERHSPPGGSKARTCSVLPGSDPKLRNEYIVITAHLDHLGRIKSENGDDIANGAMDNAMGVATLLEAARAFVESGNSPQRSILFAAVTGEEEGLLGAEYLVMHPGVAAGKIVGEVNLDMPIVTYDFQDIVAYGADHSTIGKAVADAIGRQSIKLSPDPRRSR